MSENSPKLGLPYIQPAQAQKHITHNLAVEQLDAISQLNVLGFDADTPPTVPHAGETYALGTQPTGDWAGHSNQIATHTGSGWLFIHPQEGWRAWGEGELRVWTEGSWAQVFPEVDAVARLGVNTTADDINRLSVASDSTLLNNNGNGHQLKLNKATSSDTASLLFQSNWNGHAEMGLTGDTNFAVKVSADGSNWVSPLILDSAAQQVRLAPDGSTAVTVSAGAVQIDKPVTGDAVQASAIDASAGKLLSVGAFGLGAPGSAIGDINLNDSIAPGFYHFDGTATGAPSAETYHLIHSRRSSNGGETQLALAEADGSIRVRAREAGMWSDWQKVALSGQYTGDFSDPNQAPLFERGTNANGEYTRLADGTQICWHSLDMDYSWARELFKTWTFPAIFTSNAKVVCSIDYTSLQAVTEADQVSTVAVEGATTTNSHFRLMRAAGQADFVTGDVVSLTVLAIGRWK